MRRVAALLSAVGLGTLTLVVRPPTASGCSCAAPSPGEPYPAVVVEGRAGEQTEGEELDTGDEFGPRPSSWSSAWRFVVDRVERGPVTPGDEIEVHLREGAEAGCGVDAGPLEPRRRYRVGGSFDEPTRRLHLNLCSGALVEELGEPASAEPGSRPAATAAPRSTEASVASTTTTGATDSTVVAVLEEADGQGGGLDAKVLGAASGAVIGSGVGLFALWRRGRLAPEQ